MQLTKLSKTPEGFVAMADCWFGRDLDGRDGRYDGGEDSRRAKEADLMEAAILKAEAADLDGSWELVVRVKRSADFYGISAKLTPVEGNRVARDPEDGRTKDVAVNQA